MTFFILGGNKPLYEYVTLFRDDCRRASAPVAKRRKCTVLADDLLDFHYLVVLMFLLFLMNQNCAKWFTRSKGGGCV